MLRFRGGAATAALLLPVPPAAPPPGGIPSFRGVSSRSRRSRTRNESEASEETGERDLTAPTSSDAASTEVTNSALLVQESAEYVQLEAGPCGPAGNAVHFPAQNGPFNLKNAVQGRIVAYALGLRTESLPGLDLWETILQRRVRLLIWEDMLKLINHVAFERCQLGRLRPLTSYPTITIVLSADKKKAAKAAKASQDSSMKKSGGGGGGTPAAPAHGHCTSGPLLPPLSASSSASSAAGSVVCGPQPAPLCTGTVHTATTDHSSADGRPRANAPGAMEEVKKKKKKKNKIEGGEG